MEIIVNKAGFYQYGSVTKGVEGCILFKSRIVNPVWYNQILDFTIIFTVPFPGLMKAHILIIKQFQASLCYP